MRVCQINTVSGVGSTGKICEGISDILDKHNIENIILFATEKSGLKNAERYSNNVYVKVQSLKSRIFGNWGFNSYFNTKKLIKKIKLFKPDVVQLHNLHGHNCNLSLLFKYFKKVNQKVVWTFHDCWAFTAYCCYFSMINCDKWESGCYHCPQKKQYSWFFDRSKSIYKRKKRVLTGLDLTIVTPSKWLAGLVKQSFLKDYPVKVINNGIDLTVFKPSESNFREKYNIGDKFIVLGVAFGWGKRKGLDVFIDLSKRLDNEKYQIVLVGTDDTIDMQLPKNIISIHRTQNQTELAEIYTAANVFANPTREDNYPTVNMESIACGTPVITFRTGGSPEMLIEKIGMVVDCDDVDYLEKEIRRIYKDRPYTKEDCVSQAEKFDMKDRFQEYVKLYQEL